MSTLSIRRGSDRNGSRGSCNQAIPRPIFLVDLAVSAKREGALLVVYSLSGHNCFGTVLCRYSSFRREVVEELYNEEHHVCHHFDGDCGERDRVTYGPRPLLYHPYPSFNSWLSWKCRRCRVGKIVSTCRHVDMSATCRHMSARHVADMWSVVTLLFDDNVGTMSACPRHVTDMLWGCT